MFLSDFSFRLTRPKPEAARELSSNRQDEAVPTCEGLQHLMPLNPKYMCGTPTLHYPLASAEPRSAVQGVILTSSRLKRVEFKRQQAFLSSSWLNDSISFQTSNDPMLPSHPRCPRVPGIPAACWTNNSNSSSCPNVFRKGAQSEREMHTAFSILGGGGKKWW